MPLRFFSAEEARVVTAAWTRIFPSDARGTGANEANVLIFADRQPADPYGGTNPLHKETVRRILIWNRVIRAKKILARPTGAGIKLWANFTSLSPPACDCSKCKSDHYAIAAERSSCGCERRYRLRLKA